MRAVPGRFDDADMRHKVLTQGRYATVASTLALFLALGGTAYAINTVDSLDIVNDSVQSIDVKNNGLGAVDVTDGTLRSADIADRSLQTIDFDFGEALPSRWAVVDGATGGTGPANFLLSTRTGVGTYRIIHHEPLGACAIVATPGERDGTPVDPASTATVNVVGQDVTVRTAVDGLLQDVSFEVAFLC
jgi:hypothetical protein